MITSKLTGRPYEPSNSTILWIKNCQQVATYLYHDESVFEDLLDILATKKNGKLEIVFVFEKTDRLKQLYNKWNTRSFTSEE